MSGASTILRKMAAALAALFLLLAGTPVLADACLEQAAAAPEAALSASDAGADDPCQDGCITCAQCQCHHATAAMPSTAMADSKLIAFPSGEAADPPLALTTDPTFGLKRPPRG